MFLLDASGTCRFSLERKTASWLAMVMLLFSQALSVTAQAGEADVVAAELQRSGNSWTISATVAHPDEGWDHYANAFEVLTPDGDVLATRVLYHPHVEEQPFTRSLRGVVIPADVSEIIVRAVDSVHGTGRGKTVRLSVPR